MACQTCGHTTQKVVAGVYWCSRCGTLSQPNGSYPSTEAPKLVERCRRFAEYLTAEAGITDAGKSLAIMWGGVAESIGPPAG